MDLTPKQQTAVDWAFAARREDRTGRWFLPMIALVFAVLFWTFKGLADWRVVLLVLPPLGGTVWTWRTRRYGVARCVVVAATFVVAWALEGAESFMDLFVVFFLLFVAWVLHRRLVLANVLEAAGLTPTQGETPETTADSAGR
jgi:hypothetical protein